MAESMGMTKETTMSDVQAAEGRLRALAEKATQGPWNTEACSNGGAILVRSQDYHAQRLQIVPEDDAAYIAACDPQTVLAILDALAAAERLVVQREQERDQYRRDFFAEQARAMQEGLRANTAEALTKALTAEVAELAHVQAANEALTAERDTLAAEAAGLRAVGAAVKALFDGRNMAAFPNAPHCYVVDGEALDAVKAALGAGEVA